MDRPTLISGPVRHYTRIGDRAPNHWVPLWFWRCGCGRMNQAGEAAITGYAPLTCTRGPETERHQGCGWTGTVELKGPLEAAAAVLKLRGAA